MLPGYLSAFGYVFLLLVSIYCFGYAARKSSLLYVLLLQTLLGVLIIFIVLMCQQQFRFKTLFSIPSNANLLWLASAALFDYVGGNYFTLLNLRTAGEKVNSLLSPAITAFTILLSYFIFKERLQPLQWIGVVATLVVITYFLIKRKDTANKAANWKAGLWSGIACVICISLAIVTSIKGAGNISLMQAVWLRLLFALIVVMIAFVVRKEYKKVVKQSRSFYAAILIGVIASVVVGNYLFLYASFKIGVSVFQLIIATFPLWVYASDVYLLKKSKPSRRFIITTVLAITSVAVVLI